MAERPLSESSLLRTATSFFAVYCLGWGFSKIQNAEMSVLVSCSHKDRGMFAPRFGFEAADWQKPGPARVAFAALALELGRFAAEPIIIRDGPRIEERRAELRVEGRHAEADDPDLTVTFFTDMLRTFFSSFHDHHEFVGKIRRVRPICPRPEFTGWLLNLECLNNQPETGFIMPLYVFPDSLEEGYIPKRGDLVQGLAWLQGTWKEGSSSEITTIWQKEAEEPS